MTMMMEMILIMANVIEYFDVVTGESVGDLLTKYDLGEPLCPKCQRPMEYEEGVLGQDFQGNDQWSCWHICHGDMIATSPIEINRPSE